MPPPVMQSYAVANGGVVSTGWSSTLQLAIIQGALLLKTQPRMHEATNTPARN